MAMDKEAYLKVIDVMNAAYENGDFTTEVHNEVLNALEEYHNHTNEEECLVKKAVKDNNILESRYLNYLSFIKEDKK